MKVQIAQGERFGRLIALRPLGDKMHTWECQCDCGNITSARKYDLRNGTTKSCGCGIAPTTHGLSHSAEYGIWKAMRARCGRPTAPRFDLYGGRGIRVCERWQDSFENFYADMGPRPGKGYSIDRIDTNGDYEPSNCRWATQTEQMRNTRFNRLISFHGVTKPLTAWAEDMGLHPSQLGRRLDKWPLEAALTVAPTPAADRHAIHREVMGTENEP